MGTGISILDMPAGQVFRKSEWQETFNRKGYIVLDGLSAEALRETKEATMDMLRDIGGEAPRRYFPVGQLPDFDLRKQSTAIVAKLLPDILPRHFDMSAISAYSGTHLVKPRGRGSFLSAHQDSALVDETLHHAILLWCPLQDTHWLNGRLYVLEGSHRLGNIHRSTTIPWAFRDVTRSIYRHSVPVPVKAGQVCYFHAALIHHSGYNLWEPYRVALSSLITSANAPLRNFYRGPETPEGFIEVYEADMDFFHSQDFNRRPEGYARIGAVPQRLGHVDQEFFERLLRTAQIS